MLNTTDKNILTQLMKENDELRHIIDLIYDDFHFTISKISHEIRNPLTLINSSLQIIESQHPEVKTFHFWDQTVGDVKYLRLLLEELSSYNNGEKLNISKIAIQDFLAPLVATFLPLARKSNITIDLNFEQNLPLLDIDSIKLREAFTNLIKNALDAIEQDGTISIDVTKGIDKINFKISDTGSGIDPELIHTIFTPFITYKTHGTGLGLAITQRVIESHGGSITVSSEPGKGTTFWINLPI